MRRVLWFFPFIEPLSSCELEVLQLMVEGNKNLIIAQKLYIAKATVKTHVSNILRKRCITTELRQQFERFVLA
jgi:DNA-binding NarL/FixJ family response regulator